MKEVFAVFWITGCILLAGFYLIASFSAFIPPKSFNFISLFGLAFPYLTVVMVTACIGSFFVSKKTALVLLLILPFGYYNLIHTFAFRIPQKWQSHKEDGVLRVMTWNVQNFSNFLPQTSTLSEVRVEMLQTINELKPDVVCFQEYGNIDNGTRYVSVRGELDSLGYHYYVCSNDKITHRKNNSVYSEGVAIFSKTPIFGTGRVTISTRGKEERLAFADIKLNNKTVRFFTAHLVSFYLYSDTAKSTGSGKGIYRLTYQRKRSIQYKIRETEVDHQQQVAVIREVINKSPYPVIFCGDLNTTATSYNYHTLKDGLQDAFLQKGSGLGTTFYKIVPTLRIDVCFVDKELQVLQCKVEKKELSDHYPVITDVKWKE